jgi:hypothetical protein
MTDLKVGGLVVPALYLKGWSTDKCISKFERLAHAAFTPRSLSRIPIPILSKLAKIFVSIFHNGLYDAKRFEKVLKETYGDDTTMLDTSYATTIGAKIGIPVATMDPKIILFTNYNGIGDQHARSGMK